MYRLSILYVRFSARLLFGSVFSLILSILYVRFSDFYEIAIQGNTGAFNSLCEIQKKRRGLLWMGRCSFQFSM